MPPTAIRIAVTGLGAVTPLGNDVDTLWNALIEGRSGIRTMDRFAPRDGGLPFIAGLVQGFDAAAAVNRFAAERYDPHILYAIAAARQAVADAGLAEFDAERAGVIIGTGIGGFGTAEKSLESLLCDPDAPRVSPLFMPLFLGNMAAGHVALALGMKGPNFGVNSACASGAHALIAGVDALRAGRADLMLCGGSEAPVTRLIMESFHGLGTLSSRRDCPEQASRPFDAGRDGFVIAEGAGMLVLEEWRHAERRGARVYAELLGVGCSSDAHHLTAMPPDGDGARRAMAECLRDAGLRPEAVGYVNAHGSSTPLNDKVETLAIKRLFGEHAYKLRVNSSKSMLGHMMGAAGAVESLCTVLALHHRLIHPTINLRTPDPDCDLDYCVEGPVDAADIRVGLSNSFGFGGQNACLAFGRLDA